MSIAWAILVTVLEILCHCTEILCHCTEIDGGSSIPVVMGGQSLHDIYIYGFSEEYNFDYITGSSINYVGNSIIYNINYNQYVVLLFLNKLQ